jgi:hypothetical protein
MTAGFPVAVRAPVQACGSLRRLTSRFSVFGYGPLNSAKGFRKILANVIFPAPSAAYVASVFFPLAALLALATEFAVFAYFQRKVLSKWRLLGVVVGVNVFSWLVGVALSFFGPSGIAPELVGAGNPAHILTQGPH